MDKFTLIFANNSTQFGSVCLFQTDPTAADPNIMALAWLTKAAFPTTRVAITWTSDYDFFWSETGSLATGVSVESSQAWPVNPQQANHVTFTHENAAYTFTDPKLDQSHPGLIIDETSAVPPGVARVGIAMAGAPVLLVKAQPNMTLMFSPHPKYWIAFGDYHQGQAIEFGAISNKAEVVFPPGIYTMNVTLNPDNTFTVEPGAS